MSPFPRVSPPRVSRRRFPDGWLLSVGGWPLVGQNPDDFFTGVFHCQAKVREHHSSNALLLAQHAEQDVLGADVIVVQIAGLFHRVFDDVLDRGSAAACPS